MVSLTTSTAKSNLHPAAHPLLLAYKDAGYIHRKVSLIIAGFNVGYKYLVVTRKGSRFLDLLRY